MRTLALQYQHGVSLLIMSDADLTTSPHRVATVPSWLSGSTVDSRKGEKMTVFVLLRTLGGGGEAKRASKDAPCQEEDNEPIGEIIGEEMAKRTRDIQTDRQTERQTLRLFINKLFHRIR